MHHIIFTKYAVTRLNMRPHVWKVQAHDYIHYIDYIENNNINEEHLGSKNMHLKKRGNAVFSSYLFINSDNSDYTFFHINYDPPGEYQFVNHV